MVAKETNPLKAVREAERASRTPDFLNNVKGNKKEAADTLGEAEKAASSETSATSAGSEVRSGGFYRGRGVPAGSRAGKNQKSRFKIKKGPTIAIVGIIILALVVIVPSIPFIAIGTIDHNLQEALGFSGTSAILEKVALRIVADKASNGRVPSKLADEFEDHGIVFGQVTAKGDFVRTDKYLANIDEGARVAATGFDYYAHGHEGELSVLYSGKVIDADKLVLAVESNPKMYADYSEALDIKARFYYSEDVSAVYEELGLNRSAFFNWTVTGDNEEDEKNYYEKIDEILGGDISATMGSCDDDKNCDEKSFSSDAAITNAKELGRSTTKASQLLNMAISSTEPQKAAKAFLAIEEPIQRARISGEGPINQVMNSLNRQTEFKYTDVNTGEEVTTKKSILETTNFVAAISGGSYSKAEANNFSRDRVFIATGLSSDNEAKSEIRDSILGGKTQNSPEAVLRRGGSSADDAIISKAANSVANSTSEFNSDSFTSVVGGNRAIEGGSYLSNTINQFTLGAMPSDAATIAKYQKEVDSALALKANADRASHSPFDISSPNTFLGSIAHSIASSYLGRSNRGDSGVVSAIGAVTDVTSRSADNLLGNAIADGNDRKFTTIAGDCLTTSQAANVEGDLYCNSHNTISTKYIDYTEAQWSDIISTISDEYEKFVKLGTKRDATVGIKSAAVCQEYHSGNDNFIMKFLRPILETLGIFNACQGDDDLTQVASGTKYTLSNSNSNKANVELYSGFMLFDKVNSLVEESESATSKIIKEYYKEHPVDNSAAGRIARFSGMTKEEAEIAIGYAKYLAKVRSYDPSQVLAFGAPVLDLENPLTIVKDEEIKQTLYCFWRGKTEFSDLRNRSQVA